MSRSNQRIKELLISWLCRAVVVIAMPEADCPANLLNKVQSCFADLARAVHPGPGDEGHHHGNGIGGTMSLDYSKIKQYCAEDGHMSMFVVCIEDLVSRCENSPRSAMFDRLVRSSRVRQAVPTLCTHKDEVQEASACINRAMNQQGACKADAYAKVKTDMAVSARSPSQMFMSQCKFFHSLAECQRTSVAKSCGANLGDFHADFLLSFVPSSCLDLNTHPALDLGNSSSYSATSMNGVQTTKTRGVASHELKGGYSSSRRWPSRGAASLNAVNQNMTSQATSKTRNAASNKFKGNHSSLARLSTTTSGSSSDVRREQNQTETVPDNKLDPSRSKATTREVSSKSGQAATASSRPLGNSASQLLRKGLSTTPFVLLFVAMEFCY